MNCQEIARLGAPYLSGELDAPRFAEFEKHLRSCAGCDNEVRQQKRMDGLLRDSVLAEETDTASVDQRVLLRIGSERTVFSLSRIALAAGVAAMLLAGVIGYRRMLVSITPPLCADAARDHRREVIGRQHRNWLTNANAIADLAQRNGLPGFLASALAPAGYHLERGKLCRLDGRVFLHLVYAQGSSSEFSAYLRPLDAEPISGAVRERAAGKLLREIDTGDEHIAYFQTGQLTAMFVTDQSSEAALLIARSAARLL